MISAIIYDHIHDEMVYISGVVKDIVAINGREKSRINACSSQKALAEIIKEADVEDFVCVDICEKNGTDIAAKLRCRYPGTRIMLIADASISPEQYIVPSIMASALIIRPCTREGIRERLERFVVPMLEKIKGDSDDIFVFATKEGITKIPYQQIYCFESSRKKVYIRLRTEEYSYYNTLEQLAVELPEEFVRCHRSFIVNNKRIVRYIAAENLIQLDDGTKIPVSRSYRSNIRNLVK